MVLFSTPYSKVYAIECGRKRIGEQIQCHQTQDKEFRDSQHASYAEKVVLKSLRFSKISWETLILVFLVFWWSIQHSIFKIYFSTFSPYFQSFLRGNRQVQDANGKGEWEEGRSDVRDLLPGNSFVQFHWQMSKDLGEKLSSRSRVDPADISNLQYSWPYSVRKLIFVWYPV